MNSNTLFLLFFVFYFNYSCAQNNTPLIETPQETKYTHEVVISEIDIPWGLDFINSNEFLVTEKSGILYKVSDNKKIVITGIPEIYLRGQGGFLDVAAHPSFKKNNIIYMTLSSSIGDGEGGNTALYSAVLEGNILTNLKLLYKASPNTKKGQHFGSRIVFDNSGHLFFSIGDRGNRNVNPQNINLDGGKIYRLNLDGSIPLDNPFIDNKGNKTAVYSYGHRNPQGMTRHPKTGVIWVNEHGPQGGDEINIIQKGKNYGWPKTTYGINYSGTKITDNKSLPGTEQPFYYWIPSIGPSGMTFLTSKIYNGWENSLFVGSLKFEYLERIVIEDNKVVKREKILNKIGRIRDVTQGPDGFLYVSVEGKGVVKIIPKI
jgi:glucose/arabinose dehydrogenase